MIAQRAVHMQSALPHGTERKLNQLSNTSEGYELVFALPFKSTFTNQNTGTALLPMSARAGNYSRSGSV